MDQPMDLNSMFIFWKKISSKALLCAQLFKCMKVAKLAVLQIMGYVEDKKTFSTLIFMKMIAKLTM
jgi:hypothetical protein